MQLIQFLLILIIIINIVNLAMSKNDPDVDTNAEIERHCRVRNRLVTDKKDDEYQIIEGGLGEAVMMQCHFCDENDDKHPKSWYKMDPLDDTTRIEVHLDMQNNISLNRVYVNPQHTLTIHNITKSDGGNYFCRGLDDDELSKKFNFFLDVVIPSDLPPEKGNMTNWRKYHDENLEPINKFLSGSNENDVRYLKDDLKVDLELETSWGRASPCEVCGRPKGDGRKYTEGYCRFKITHKGTPEEIKQNPEVKMVMRSTHLSCRSVTLHDLVPSIINRTSYIPDFLLVETCDGICNPDAKGIYRGWRSTKKGFKYKKTFVLAENAHLTLICPESTLENQVEWKINNMVIRPGQSKKSPSEKIEARVFVDSFNTLYLYGVTKDEEGNYTCYVDKARMQQVRVFVVSKAKLLTQAFVRHMMYLAFVLSLTISCYCAGLVVTYVRRHKFQTYYEKRHELKAKNKIIEDDLSDLTPSDEEKATSTSFTPKSTTTPLSMQPTDELEDVIIDSNEYETVENEFEFVDNEFETVDNEYETADNEYETVDNEYETVDNEFESTENEYHYVSPESDYDNAGSESEGPLLKKRKKKKKKTKVPKQKKNKKTKKSFQKESLEEENLEEDDEEEESEEY